MVRPRGAHGHHRVALKLPPLPSGVGVPPIDSAYSGASTVSNSGAGLPGIGGALAWFDIGSRTGVDGCRRRWLAPRTDEASSGRCLVRTMPRQDEGTGHLTGIY